MRVPALDVAKQDGATSAESLIFHHQGIGALEAAVGVGAVARGPPRNSRQFRIGSFVVALRHVPSFQLRWRQRRAPSGVVGVRSESAPSTTDSGRGSHHQSRRSSVDVFAMLATGSVAAMLQSLAHEADSHADDRDGASMASDEDEVACTFVPDGLPRVLALHDSVAGAGGDAPSRDAATALPLVRWNPFVAALLASTCDVEPVFAGNLDHPPCRYWGARERRRGACKLLLERLMTRHLQQQNPPAAPFLPATLGDLTLASPLLPVVSGDEAAGEVSAAASSLGVLGAGSWFGLDTPSSIQDLIEEGSPHYTLEECAAIGAVLFETHFRQALSRQLFHFHPDSHFWKVAEAMLGEVATRTARWEWRPRLAAQAAAQLARDKAKESLAALLERDAAAAGGAATAVVAPLLPTPTPTGGGASPDAILAARRRSTDASRSPAAGAPPPAASSSASAAASALDAVIAEAMRLESDSGGGGGGGGGDAALPTGFGELTADDFKPPPAHGRRKRGMAGGGGDSPWGATVDATAAPPPPSAEAPPPGAPAADPPAVDARATAAVAPADAEADVAPPPLPAGMSAAARRRKQMAAAAAAALDE
jgi:hypothetical protein